jgi:CBS domain-containing protein
MASSAAKPWEGPMKVREAMSQDVETVRSKATVEDVAQRMAKRGIGYFPVCDRGLLVGVITDRDITCRIVADRRRAEMTRVADIMSKGVAYCLADDDLTTAIHVMEQNRIRRIPVLDHNDHLVGVLSLTDVARRAPHRLTAELLEAVSREAPLSVTINPMAGLE